MSYLDADSLPPAAFEFDRPALKGAQAPDWMVHGIAAKDKGRDQVTMQLQSTVP